MEDTVLLDIMQETLLDDSVGLDLMEELLSEEVWLGTPQDSDLLRWGASASPNLLGSSSYLSPLCEIENGFSNRIPEGYHNNRDVKKIGSSKIPPQVEEETEVIIGGQLDPCSRDFAQYPVQYSEPEKAGPSSWSVEPRANPGKISSLKERLAKTLSYIKESYRDCDVLIQIWVPVNIGGRQVLTTCGQPFSLNPNCQRLMNYREISTTYQFSAEENSKEALGLPGRVFLGKLPEWSPDARYFSTHEYSRVNYAQCYDVRGTLGIPVFKHRSRVCLGVLEIVMTTERINYHSDLKHICNALKAVDLSTSEVPSIPHVKMKNDSYLAALPEISVILRAVCEAHGLPLAQTWIPCLQQGKSGSRHSDDNYEDCVSTVDASCYVNDAHLSGFHEACSEHHLLRGQGVVGKAFITNQPCFSSDITAFSKTEYPLSHHARIFGLRAVVAICLPSVQIGKADFVLEFFLPRDCRTSEEQKAMFNSLFVTLQQICQNLRVVTEKELRKESVLQVNAQLPEHGEHGQHSDGDNERQDRSEVSANPRIGESGMDQSSDPSILEIQQKDKNGLLPACALLGFEERGLQGFSVTSQWGSYEVELPEGELSSVCKLPFYQASATSYECGNSVTGRSSFPTGGKVTERKHTKTEKIISLQLLRQYFAGSLKDAAKNLGVCTTTLKRICRQHGITRWPSRKIKKVGHSLRKLQVVIDSVPGVDGSFQLSSLYANLPKTCGSDMSTQKATGKGMICIPKQDDAPESSNAQHGFRNSNASASNSPFSSCSQTSGSSHSCSSEAKQCTYAAKFPIKKEVSFEENQSGTHKRASSEVELHLSSQETPGTLVRSQSLKAFGENSSPGSFSPLCQNMHTGSLLRVKATYGEETIRFSLQPSWGIRELKQEIVKRFHISNMNSVGLKYLDDESEWVLLTCDADLLECVDIYRSSSIRTIKISVHHVAQTSTTSFGSR